jgi:hypothetical protein
MTWQVLAGVLRTAAQRHDRVALAFGLPAADTKTNA